MTETTMTETTMIGTQCRIYPTGRQAAIMDSWRRRNRALWNLLLELQQAAYNGENVRSKLAWRKTWAHVVKDDYVEAERIYREGKVTKSGEVKKEPGIGREAEREALKAKLKDLEKQKKKNTDEFKTLKAQITRIAGKPKPVDPALLERIQWQWRWDGAPLRERLMHKLFGYLARQQCDHTHKHTLAWLAMKKLSAKADDVIAWLTSHDGPCDCTAAKASKEHYTEISREFQPRLLWAGESSMMVLQKIMARLKKHPQTRWIEDLSSHTAQKTVKDMVGAIDSMLRERSKAARGEPNRKTGFPRFKPNHYAAGSAYFAYTQIAFRAKPKRKVGHDERVTKEFSLVKLPNGVGWMECRLRADIAAAHEYGEADLMGARIWRRGESWFMSCQWKVPKRAPLPATGRTAAIKIAASIPITIYDDRGQIFESAPGRKFNGVPMELPPIDKDLLAHHATAGRAQSRCLEARKRRVKKREAYYGKRQAQKLAKGIAAKEPGRARFPLTPGFYRAAALLAKLEGQDRDKRDDWMHQITTQIVRSFDVIAVQKMEVARMMEKPAPPEEKEDQLKPAWQGKRRSLKAARVMMRRTAMTRIQQVLKYKQLDLRGEAAYEELDALYPTVQPCSRCGAIHPEMKDGKKVLRCAEVLADGSICGNVLPRHRNAARVVGRELAKRLKQRQGTA